MENMIEVSTGGYQLASFLKRKKKDGKPTRKNKNEKDRTSELSRPYDDAKTSMMNNSYLVTPSEVVSTPVPHSAS